MNYADHIEAAESFLSGQEEAMEAGRGMLAAEAIWGATVQVIDAANHARGRRAHANNTRDRQRAIQYLQHKYRDVELEAGFRTALRQLHNHFYRGHLSDSELDELLESGRRFIVTMIELAEREMEELSAQQAEAPESASDAAPPV